MFGVIFLTKTILCGFPIVFKAPGILNNNLNKKCKLLVNHVKTEKDLDFVWNNLLIGPEDP